MSDADYMRIHRCRLIDLEKMDKNQLFLYIELQPDFLRNLLMRSFGYLFSGV
ncbi:hypothetical protein AB4454_07180 [Vibrio artabrorum]|uniref:Uncharacterized protein n=1 Tax=Vibrio sp. 1F_97 TaxID=1652827 RepID=A0A0H3ZUT4_9VIBR|nr:hypothetical protein [Vibrio cyclitrophicus]AKN37306.1 hypothetical protein [Vibrio sp. 1F_97]ELB2912165.1 hypothetical protein [Vibrio parahaemolyticus]HBI3715667.1 hypothetical protein [Vibrio parahaemolyticus]